MAAEQFCVSVGTDLFGTKRNIKLDFPRCPTMSELINAVESQYDVEMRASRPAGYPDIPFKVQTFQLYDDVLQRWVDLYSSAQLSPFCTVFCFQPESIWHSDAQGIIPEAKTNVTWTTPVGSPRRARVATDAGVAPTLSEKLRSVFYDCDVGNKGYVLYSDLRSAFGRCDIEFTYATVGELFTDADANRSGHITYDEWVTFAIKYPAIIDALFFRSRDVKVDTNAVKADEAARLSRQAELRAMYERQQWQPQPPPPAAPPVALPPSGALAEQEAALHAQKGAATAAAARQAELQEIADQQAAQAAQSNQRLQELQAAIDAQREVAQREAQSSQEANAALEAQKQVLQQEATKQAEMQARLEHTKKQEAEIANRARQAAMRDAEEAQRQMAMAEAAQRAAQQRAAELQAQEAARAQAEMAARQEVDRRAADATAEYEAARREADSARIQKEMAEQRERQAWDKLYYQPNSPHYQ